MKTSVINRFYKRLEQQLRSNSPISSSMTDILDLTEKLLPHKDWQLFRQFDVESEIPAASRWVPRVLKRSPAAFPIKGIYFGLGDFTSGDIEFSRLYFGVMGQFNAKDKDAEWVFGKHRHYPDRAYLSSKILKTTGVHCYGRNNGLGLEGHYCFSMAYASLLVREISTPSLYKSLGTSAKKVGLLCGFDSGDIMRLGILGPDGFQPTAGAMI